MSNIRLSSDTETVGPGRPREFDLDEAVEAAGEVFRTRGYHGTSVQDLTEGTGIARGSLYKAFHDKRSLFLAALEQSTSASVQRIAATLSQPGPVKIAIRDTLMGYAQRAAAAQGQRGCMITTAAMEVMPSDADATVIITRMFRQIQDLFAATIIRGQATGEIPRHIDDRATARLFLCTIQGLRVLGKTGPAETETIDMVDAVMRTLA